ncbi:ABC transporter ATP-binding protein [Limosilactobacillus coleohominis]|uniref:Putative hemin import ATP-binding protein HrtA n=1 Tax=Limosilactobacillus coleohominis TaxID=181675 RepID=A0ABS2H0K4_9LACO|nr:ABC transporter ATP-binding protein [Limosilactobacillus coleohominis]MBM6940783.1 ABC transporter ATP-binding protein [Limosilactobacillus coleohominis]MBM6954557.1 ABC transporter ATP-binding protein [Limosilactobacillus coleohominis]
MPTIELKNVNKTFGTGIGKVQALTNINFEARTGELTLILGPSGSGKSTFLTIAGGLRQPSSGDVIIDGQNISAMKPRQLDRLRLNKIGFVLQSYNLLPYLTVAEQFRLVDHVHPQNNLNNQELEQLLKELDIDHLKEQYPDQLSGGQNQRIAIARALYTNPPIVLADEPTAALDSERGAAVGREFQKLAHRREKTIIVVTHDLRLRKYADRIFEINDGKIEQTK